MASELALVLLSVLFVSAYPEECPDLVALPSPYADSSFSGTVRKTVDERTYGIEINDIHYGADIPAAPSSCWTSHEGLQLLLIELDSKSTRCRLTMTVGRTYIFSVHASQTSCPTLFQDGVYSPVLLPTHLTADRDRVVRQTAEVRIPYPDNEGEKFRQMLNGKVKVKKKGSGIENLIELPLPLLVKPSYYNYVHCTHSMATQISIKC